MVKLIGILGSDIDLDIKAAADFHSTNRDEAEMTNSHHQYGLTYGSRDVDLEETQAQKDAKAFQELQSYADFQKVLSNRVEDDIMRDEKYCPIDPRILSQVQESGDYFYHKPYIHPSLQRPNLAAKLPCPVIIPSRRPETKRRGWVRAYSPALMDCGIDQNTFLRFLDTFNESTKSLPYLDAVNVADFGFGSAPGMTPTLVSMAVPVAMKMAKTSQTVNKTIPILTRANNELFIPHGLFAMVLTYKPTTSSQANTVDSVSYSLTSQPNDSSHLPTSAPLIFLETEHTAIARPHNRLRQIGHFIADYGDRRAQTRYALEHSESAIVTPPPNFRSRWTAPNHPADSGGFPSLIIGKSGRDDTRKPRKRRERKNSTSSKSSKAQEAQKSILQGRKDGDREGKDDQGSQRGMKMTTDVLYLIIANNPIDNSEQSAFNNLTTKNSQMPYPYRETKLIKSPEFLEPDPFQQRGVWSLDSGFEWLAKDQHAQTTGYQSALTVRGSSPPPAYENSRRGDKEESQSEKRTRVEYCVPTL